ncbi:two-component regulator propeller domain-containing protein [Luteimonas sp. R10]|uniref:ligand-binding sensor domain-containing protein n=1 Tax=Luteimonas sp. R10 TaxID=3108176 RepID=UPI003085BD84|nr:two-component regulator propeller domain-containing protein [Luteimonas sp. R10]
MALVAGLLAAGGPVAAAPVVQPDERIVPRTFTADDGLPQSGVNAIVQTRDGYLWIGTFGGLARFDGMAFETFRGQSGPESAAAKDGRRKGPASDRIIALHEDDAGRLWIGTQDAGLSVLEHGMFRHLPVCDGVCQVSDLLQGPDGAIWIASSAGVLKLGPDSRQETWIARLDWAGYVRLSGDARGRIHVGGHRGFGVVADGRIQPIRLPGSDRRVYLLERSGDHLLVGTEHTLYRYDPDRRHWQPLGVDRPDYAIEDADGHWWVAQASGRLVREDAAGNWRNVPGLSGVDVTSLSRDNEGNLWIGSSSKGLLRFRKPLFGVIAVPQPELNVAGRAVVADGQGGLWFGSACGQLGHWRQDGSMQVLPIRQVLGNDCVASLLLDRDGMLWVGTNGGGLGRIVDGEAEHVFTWPAGESINLWQREDRRYVVGSERATFELEIDARGRIVGRRDIDALKGMHINQMIEAAQGGHWFAGDQGVLRLVDGEAVERWTPAEGLSSRFARALYEDERTRTLWVGTYGGGLNRIRNGQVQRYDSGNGLFDDTVSCILADNRGRLWLGGNRGVTLLPAPREAAATIESIGYTAGDGLVPSEINGGTASACHRDTQGRLWFSLVEGFAVVDPADVAEVRAAPLRPHIERVAVAGRAVEFAGPTLVLESFARNLEIRYTAVNLSKPRDTHFRFRLSGFDDDWIEAGQNRSILYPSIPWGEHLFEVQARIAGGPWSPEPASLRIVHPRPWYQRPWVWTLATLLGLLALVGSTQIERVGPDATGRSRRRGGDATARSA